MARDPAVEAIKQIRESASGDFQYGFEQGGKSTAPPRPLPKMMEPVMNKLAVSETMGPDDLAKRALRSQVAGRFFRGSLSKLGAHLARFIGSGGRALGAAGFTLPAETFSEMESKVEEIMTPPALRRTKPVRRRV